MIRLLTDPYRVSISHEKCFTPTVTMASTNQGDELSTTFNKVRLNLVFISTVLERESRKGVDALRPAELWNDKLDIGLTERLAIEIEIRAFHIEVLRFRPAHLLFTRIICDAHM